MEEANRYAKAEMLIRKPVAEVYEAFINPEITTKFWFTKSSGRLDENKNITWTWEMYNHSVDIDVVELQPNKKIAIMWGNYESKTPVVWTFAEHGEDTFVSVTNSGFTGDEDIVLSIVRDSTEGFTLVLSGLKAYLEHGIELNLVKDRFPQ
ncbi:polyketide cyclase [Elizabethkingia meningoseptica]|uniref:Polyketide cyclase n=1 Tax=Elizabethkingia meningoseptica TaxID=238 RepID=A0A1T3FHB4_ELIME|nr:MULTISPECIES: SRPBCC family protein [Elizabethkingia]AQX12790.1 polyketide cyclase [Elizabethkingia meningoseptica]MBG0514308.1 SRPBCC family protein [Elizabethkingia meningoseptica]MDE5433224.1 SRPBCC family protein [Elizabethkingia meningoseptica]MDE5450537.1 SRPBCC family protein [Elizabethkingia meningoseptica]MDE5471413.1 SRPBCC family protein [Elizabethkingia meningoseptica]